MTLYLVHHAEAVAPDIDHMRPLSSSGRLQADRVAEALQAHGAAPVSVLHSGKLRARETAFACLRRVNPMARFSAARGLQPGDDPRVFADYLVGEEADVLAAGHMPHLARLLAHLTGSAADFPPHGAVALVRGADRWTEIWRYPVGPAA